jgi:hypothetical protein
LGYTAAHPLRFAPAELKANREVVRAAVAQFGNALRCASAALQADRELVLLAIATEDQQALALRNASADVKDDKEVVLTAVQMYGHALEFASARLRAVKEVVLAAMANDTGSGHRAHPSALEFASTELQADKEVVLTAVAKNRYALGFASAALQVDNEVVLTAVMHSRDMLDSIFLPDEDDRDKAVGRVEGLRAYMRTLARARRSLRTVLFATRFPKGAPVGVASPPAGHNGPASMAPAVAARGGVLLKLNANGRDHAALLKRRIGSFVGVPDGPDWRGWHLDNLPGVCDGPNWAALAVMFKECWTWYWDSDTGYRLIVTSDNEPGPVHRARITAQYDRD